ncbi:hypothetical protein HYS94_01905 [Candidatus Daviesbacteria bacterium]|nr:hypothetical protein [Candidatus Daviesbacteria bacterium]
MIQTSNDLRQAAMDLLKDIHNEALLTDVSIYENNIEEAICSLYRLSAFAEAAADYLKQEHDKV